jgi:hypothetical protein
MKRFFLLLLLSSPLIALAQPVVYKPLAQIDGVDYTSLSGYLTTGIQVVIGVAGLLAVFRLVMCGFTMVSSPSPSARSEAKSCIWGAVLGLILVLSSWLILNSINKSLVSTSIVTPPLPQGP